MDDVLFGVKRAHLAVNAWALGKLRELAVTPARFDLMRLIYAHPEFRVPQSDLRKHLGVARATISRMLIALERLGWIMREVNVLDRRTRDCILTYEGRRICANVMTTLIWPRVIAKIVDAALGAGDVNEEREAAGSLALRLVFAFASRHVWRVVGYG